MIIEELIKKLQVYPKDMQIVDSTGKNFVHIVNNQNNVVILSVEKPQGECNNCGDYVYTETNKYIDYPYICPTCNENKYEFEITKINNI